MYLLLDPYFQIITHCSVLVLQGAWIRAGVNDTTRYVPVNLATTKTGIKVCFVLTAVQAHTGLDQTIKFETKTAGLTCNLETYLVTL